MPDESGPVTTSIEDGVAVLRFDDGKANVLSMAALPSFDAALDRAEAGADGVHRGARGQVLSGVRPVGH